MSWKLAKTVKYLVECSMSVNTWLEQHASGYQELQSDERLAILHFSLLWSLFEAEVLTRNGGVDSIAEAVNQWERKGLLTQEIFGQQIKYFRRRYCVNGKFTYDFMQLHLCRSGSPELVKEVLRNEDANAERVATAILIIVYRIRNNLFHGEKWSYGLRGQLENFNHANAALMKAIELQGRVTKNNQLKFSASKV